MTPIFIITLFISSVFAQNSQNDLSVTLEEENLDDSITEIFNICKCVIFYLCDEENFIIPEDQVPKKRVLMNSSMRSLYRIRCSNDFYYCCKNRNETPPKVFSTTSTPLVNNQVVSSQKLVEKYPWMVAIFRKSDNKYKFKCGGSLIHPKVVMTQQQCVYSSSSRDVRIVNGYETLTPNVKFFSVSKIIKHESYVVQSVNPYDIALLILQTPLTNVKTVWMPNPSQSFGGRRCVSVSWSGAASSDRRQLQETDMPIIDSQNCQRLLQNSSLGWNLALHSSFLCVDAGDGVCNDEGGGPLMCETNGVYIQAGIARRRLTCGQMGVPGLYTNVGYFSYWVRAKLMMEDLD